MAKLELNEEQLRIIQNALDFYGRVGIGQIGRVLDHPTYENYLSEKFLSGEDRDFGGYHKKKDDVTNDLIQARDDVFFDDRMGRNGSFGFSNKYVDESCKIAFDMIQVIRHEFWKINPNRSDVTVDSSVILHSGGKDIDKFKCEL